MKTTLHLHRHEPPAAPLGARDASFAGSPHGARSTARSTHSTHTTLRLGLVLSLVAAVLAIVIEAVVHLPAVLILIPVVIVGFALSWRASGPDDGGRGH